MKQSILSFDFFFFSCMLKMAGFNLFYPFVLICERNKYIYKKKTPWLSRVKSFSILCYVQKPVTLSAEL